MPDRIVRVEDDPSFVRLTMAHGPNALDEALVDALIGALEDLVSRGAPPVLLTSAHDSLFCPGWDLKRLAHAGYDDVERFLSRFNTLIVSLFSYPSPTVAAIGGHAVAGGCLLALACDQRVMATGRPRIGLSEINLGVPVPFTSVHMLRARLAPSVFEAMVLAGEGYPAQRAVELGVVQRAKAPEEVVTTAEAETRRRAAQPRRAYSRTKDFAYAETRRIMRAANEDEDRAFLECWFEASTQDRLQSLARGLGR